MAQKKKRNIEKEMKDYKKIKKIVEPFFPKSSKLPEKEHLSDWKSFTTNDSNLFGKSI